MGCESLISDSSENSIPEGSKDDVSAGASNEGRPAEGRPAVAKRRAPSRLLVAGLLTVAFVLFDLGRAPQQQWTTRGLLLAIDAYQATLSKAMPTLGVQCRFQPTCSRYTEQAIRLHGAFKGTRLGAWRLLRCGPWTEAQTLDPPPPADPSKTATPP